MLSGQGHGLYAVPLLALMPLIRAPEHSIVVCACVLSRYHSSLSLSSVRGFMRAVQGPPRIADKHVSGRAIYSVLFCTSPVDGPACPTEAYETAWLLTRSTGITIAPLL
ncbi:hypothetical protein F4802DRAFT_90747 [Xylaria palmicola]|nr:hypothetical protein F4802DRAFT_90747 [Xylaria palmicola]